MDWGNDRPNEGLADGCFVVHRGYDMAVETGDWNESIIDEGGNDKVEYVENFREHSRVDGHEWKSGDIRVSCIPPAALRAEKTDMIGGLNGS